MVPIYFQYELQSNHNTLQAQLQTLGLFSQEDHPGMHLFCLLHSCYKKVIKHAKPLEIVDCIQICRLHQGCFVDLLPLQSGIHAQ